MSESRDENGRTVINLNDLEDGALRRQEADGAAAAETLPRFTPTPYSGDGRGDGVRSAAPIGWRKYSQFLCRGLKEDVTRRAKFYVSDYMDAFRGERTIGKVVATIVFLYFGIILPCVAFGVLDDKNTHQKIDARRAIIGQAIGGIVFHLLAGQPLVIIATTAPLCLYIEVCVAIAENFGVSFEAFYACVGLWCAFFCVVYALLDVSIIMKYCTRSSEEIFATFIFFAFSKDAIKDCVKSFEEFYRPMVAGNGSNVNATHELNLNPTNLSEIEPGNQNDRCVLFLFLMLATVWLANLINKFRSTTYLSDGARDLFADYALPLAVVVFSFVGTYLFRGIEVEKFAFSDSFEFSFTDLSSLNGPAVGIACLLGFVLSLLFFMDQNISAAMVNRPENRLKKGSGYHLDLLVVGILNGFLSLLRLPWMHGILPHSPMHAAHLAELEEVDHGDGHVTQEVVYIRENRVTGLVAHLLIALSLLAIPILVYIPVPVLDGLFLFMALGTLTSNNLYNRTLLWFTPRDKYPPLDYVRNCPERAISVFTVYQLVQLVILIFFGFFPLPYVQMAFPVVIALFIPARIYIAPRLVEQKYLEYLDPMHHLHEE